MRPFLMLCDKILTNTNGYKMNLLKKQIAFYTYESYGYVVGQLQNGLKG